jgi:hypothetical protein
VLAVSGGAYAAVTASSPTISVCVHHRGGGLYSGRSCARHDRRLTWNVIGPLGPPGRNGVNGINGVNGVKGKNGLNGAPGAIVLTRVRSTQAVSSLTATTASPNPNYCEFSSMCADPANGAPVALTGGAWTQASNQLNQFVGQISVTPPNSSSGTYYNTFFGTTLPGVMVGEIDDAATGSALATFTAAPASATPTAATTPLTVATLFEPGAVVNHALIVKIADNCGTGGNGAVAGGHFTLNSLALDPVGIS